jgi:hypothetical protein
MRTSTVIFTFLFLLFGTPFAFAQNPEISILTNDGAYLEGLGLCFNVRLVNPSPQETSVDVLIDPSSTCTLGEDFTLSPTTVVFPPNTDGNMSVCVLSNLDGIVEPVEYLTLTLANPTNNATLGDNTLTYTFYDRDSITNTAPCQQVFISEYLHSLVNGGSRALEIYNPTLSPIDLSAYNFRIYTNGNSEPDTSIYLSGSLDPGEVYVLASPISVQEVLDVADQLSDLLVYSGDDAVGLYQGDQLVDIVGIIGEDPGISWPAGMRNTSSAALTRDSIIRQGEQDWHISAAHWTGYNQNNYSHLGSHFMLPCDSSGNIPPTITIITSDAERPEEMTTYAFAIALYNPADTETTVEINLGSNTTATLDADFTYQTGPIVFPANTTSTQYVSVNFLDDTIEEQDELIEMILHSPNNSANLVDSVWQITILANDAQVSSQNPAQDSGLSLFPNPVRAGEWLSVQTSDPTIRYHRISNLSGSWQHQFSATDWSTQAGSLRVRIPDAIPAGMYVLYSQDAAIPARKIIIE